MDVLDALPLHQQSLHILFGLLQLPLQLTVLLLNVFVVLVQLLVLVPQHQQLLLLVLNVAHQVAVGLVGLFQQRPCDLQLVVGLFEFLLSPPQQFLGLLVLSLFGLQSLGQSQRLLYPPFVGSGDGVERMRVNRVVIGVDLGQ